MPIQRNLLLVAAILAAAFFVGAGLSTGEEAVTAITKPSKDVTLSFARIGRITEIPVKEGDPIKADQLVANMDDREEKAAYEYDKYRAGDLTDIEKQKAILEQKKIDLQQKVNSGSAVTRYELDNAKLEVTVAQANVKLAEFEHEQNGRKFEQSKAALDKMQMKSPIDGTVEQLIAKAGEGVDQQSKLMRIVNIDPLWVETPVKLARARQAATGDGAKVTFSDGVVREGKIIFIAKVADAASDTLLIRVEVPNPKKIPAGERVSVALAEKKSLSAATQPDNTAKIRISAE